MIEINNEDNIKIFQEFVYEKYNVFITKTSIFYLEKYILNKMNSLKIEEFDEYLKVLQNEENKKDLLQLLYALNMVSINEPEYIFSIFMLLLNSYKNNDKIRILSFNSFNSVEHIFILLAIELFINETNYKGSFLFDLIEYEKKQEFILHKNIFPLTEKWENQSFVRLLDFFTKKNNGYLINKNLFKKINIIPFQKVLKTRELFDVILYKNWTIGINQDKKIHKAKQIKSLIRGNGYLILGRNELLSSKEIFKTIHLKKMIVHMKI